MGEYKWYKYHGYRFCATHNFIEARVNRFGWSRKEIRPVYHIDGLKDAGTRPLLTSVRQCKGYIDLAIWKARHNTDNANTDNERSDNA
jgi:hypothetical protein